jgi:hypothetical protein
VETAGQLQRFVQAGASGGAALGEMENFFDYDNRGEGGRMKDEG